MIGLGLYLACSAPKEDTGPVARDSGHADSGDSGRVDTGRIDTGRIDTGDSGDSADTAPPPQLAFCINELMPDNETALVDAWGDSPDWIELHNPTDSAIDLDGAIILDDRSRHTIEGLVLEPGAFLLLYADEAIDRGPDHLGFKLAAEGGSLSIFSRDGAGTIVNYGSMAADFSLARTTDCCSGDSCLGYDFRGTPGVTNEPVVYEDVTLLAAGSRWAYWDAGASAGADWSTSAFDDSAWARGAAPLGYGDGHIVTTVSYGTDAFNKHITTWFRTTFAGPASLPDALSLSLLRDDGAVVYLNGTEVARSNLPSGALTDSTLASSSVGPPDETTYWSFSVDPALLRTDWNTLAVELHQASLDSSDLGFDLSLVGKVIVER